jgi:hypothetical protein
MLFEESKNEVGIAVISSPFHLEKYLIAVHNI